MSNQMSNFSGSHHLQERPSFHFLLEAADYTERGEQGRESGNNHLDDCLDDVLLHSLSERPSKSP